jgi:hypothetical protein
MGSHAVRTVQTVARKPRAAKSLLRAADGGAVVEGMSTAKRKRRTVADPKKIARG